jgi:hypothetical protein
VKCYLRIGDDTLQDAKRYHSICNAEQKFLRVARELASYGQAITGSIHVGRTREEIVEDPDYVLSLSERGALIKEKC